MPNYELEMAESVIAGRELKILELEAEITRLTAQRDRATKKVLLIDEDVVRLTAIEVAARRLTSLERWQMSSEDWDDLDKALAAYKP